MAGQVVNADAETDTRDLTLWFLLSISVLWEGGRTADWRRFHLFARRDAIAQSEGADPRPEEPAMPAKGLD